MYLLPIFESSSRAYSAAANLFWPKMFNYHVSSGIVNDGKNVPEKRTFMIFIPHSPFSVKAFMLMLKRDSISCDTEIWHRCPRRSDLPFSGDRGKKFEN